jgi:hypothetical protein
MCLFCRSVSGPYKFHHLPTYQPSHRQTPNFALDVDDVQYTGPHENIPKFIGDVTDPFFLSAIHNNSDARQPDDDSAWPPALIFDFFYGCAALNAWGEKPFKTFVKKLNSGNYYHEAKSGESNDDGRYKQEGTSQQAMDRRARREAEERKRKRDDQEEYGWDSFGETMDLMMGLWMRQARKRQPKQDVPEVDHSKQEIVRAWLAVSATMPFVVTFTRSSNRARLWFSRAF